MAVINNKVGCASRTDVKSMVREAQPTKLKTQYGKNSQILPNNPSLFSKVAIKPFPERNCLGALTTAALILPGLITPPPSHATEGDEVDFQYSHYQEGKRDYAGMYWLGQPELFSQQNLPNQFNPIEVDSLHGSAKVSLTDRVKFAFNYTQDTWSGATPVSSGPVSISGNKPRFKYITDSQGNTISSTYAGASPYAGDLFQLYFDNKLNPLAPSGGFDNTTGYPNLRPAPGWNDRIVHTLAIASPETRKQGDFKLSYEWDDAAIDVGGGISVENDYESRFGSLSGRMDFNNKQTTVNAAVSYTNSDTFATLDPDSLQFYDTLAYDNSKQESAGYDQNGNDIWAVVPVKPQVAAGEIDSVWDTKNFQRNSAILRGNRQDWSSQLGLTQILSKNAVAEFSLNYNRSTGYLGNPYKLVTELAIRPSVQQLNDPNAGAIAVGALSRLEIRPDERNQFNWSAGFNYYVEALDAALHFDYHFAHDDWGIHAHTFEADWVQPLGSGWTVTPRIRYYSQSAAEFYSPYLTTIEVIDPDTGNLVNSPLNRSLPNYYSSDHRLSGFGTLSGGITIAKQFAKGIGLETGFEYYTHQGGLKIGGGGEQAFADYDFWVANAALKVNLEAIGAMASENHGSQHKHDHHAHPVSPAGVMFDHALAESGDFMLGYRFQRSEQAGDILFGSQPVSPTTINLQGCGDTECHVAPTSMVMNMHMLDLMYAPTDWLTVMLMPQWMDMDMDMKVLVNNSGNGHNHGGAPHSHQTGGIGDTGLYALFKLLDQPNHHITLSLGGTAPTGDVNITLRKTATNSTYGIPIHYGMQLGSGTWDFKPSLTYTGETAGFVWGAQATGTVRLESQNASNFAFGDIFQGSAWGGYRWTNWLATTVRGVYTWQDSISGEYPTVFDAYTGDPYVSKHVGTFDKPGNYGGQFVDLGLGFNVTVPEGAFAGNTIKFEWLQPLHTDYNGYQLDRDGALSATWSMMF